MTPYANLDCETTMITNEVNCKWRITYGCYHSDGEIKRPGELPLDSGFVGLQKQHDLLNLIKVKPGEVVFMHEQEFAVVEFALLAFLLLWLESVENSRSDEQIGQSADD